MPDRQRSKIGTKKIISLLLICKSTNTFFNLQDCAKKRTKKDKKS